MIRLALETAVSSDVTGVTEVSAPNAAGRTNGKYLEDDRIIIYDNGKKYKTGGTPVM